jgi:hypothetical protein
MVGSAWPAKTTVLLMPENWVSLRALNRSRRTSRRIRSPSRKASRHSYRLKEEWPFLWFENEYVVGTTTTFILAANAAEALTR